MNKFIVLVLLSGALLLASTYVHSQSAPQAPPAIQIPQPEEITVGTIKLSLADAILSRDNCNAYAVTLQKEIAKLAGENQKLKDEIEKLKPADPSPAK